MLADSDSDIKISAFQWVPDFAQGMVRDIRIRWALEEIERPYDTSLFDPAARCQISRMATLWSGAGL